MNKSIIRGRIDHFEREREENYKIKAKKKVEAEKAEATLAAARAAIVEAERKRRKAEEERNRYIKSCQITYTSSGAFWYVRAVLRPDLRWEVRLVNGTNESYRTFDPVANAVFTTVWSMCKEWETGRRDRMPAPEEIGLTRYNEKNLC